VEVVISEQLDGFGIQPAPAPLTIQPERYVLHKSLVVCVLLAV